MEVICLETEAFYTLIEEVVGRLRAKENSTEEKWIQSEVVMDLLGIKSKSTMQRLRDEGKIRYSQPHKKIILYDRQSVLEYLDAHAKETF